MDFSFLLFQRVRCKHLLWPFFPQRNKIQKFAQSLLRLCSMSHPSLIFSLPLLHTLSLLNRPVSQNSRFFDCSYLSESSFLPRTSWFFLCRVTVWPAPSESISRMTGFMALTVHISFAVCTCILDVTLPVNLL